MTGITQQLFCLYFCIGFKLFVSVTVPASTQNTCKSQLGRDDERKWG